MKRDPKYPLWLLAGIFVVAVLALFLPFYSGYTHERVNATSYVIEDVGYMTTFTGIHTVFAWFGLVTSFLLVILNLVRQRGKVVWIIIAAIYGLAFIFLLFTNMLTLGARPFGDTMEYGFLLMNAAIVALFVMAAVKAFRAFPPRPDSDLLDDWDGR